MKRSQNENYFLFYCQEGKLKSMKYLIDNGYEPSENALHEALYFVIDRNYKNCYHYVITLFEKNNFNINLYYNNGLIFDKALLNEKIGIHLLNNNYFLTNHRDNFQIHFLNLLQRIKSSFYLEKFFTVLVSSGYTNFLEDKLRKTILSKEEYTDLRIRILKTFRIRHIIEEF